MGSVIIYVNEVEMKMGEWAGFDGARCVVLHPFLIVESHKFIYRDISRDRVAWKEHVVSKREFHIYSDTSDLFMLPASFTR